MSKNDHDKVRGEWKTERAIASSAGVFLSSRFPIAHCPFLARSDALIEDRGYAEFPRTPYTGSPVSEKTSSRTLVNKVVPFLERLNSPIALAVTLLLFLVLDGFLLYRYQQALQPAEDEVANAPVEEASTSLKEESTVTEETSSSVEEEPTAAEEEQEEQGKNEPAQNVPAQNAPAQDAPAQNAPNQNTPDPNAPNQLMPQQQPSL